MHFENKNGREIVNIKKTQIFINYIVLICITLVPLVIAPFNLFSDFFYLPKVYAITILAILFLYVLIKNRMNICNIIWKDQTNLYLIIYLILLITSLFFALDFNLAIQGSPYRVEGFSTLLLYFLMFLTARASSLTKNKLFYGLLISSTVLSIYGIFQYFGMDIISRDFIRTNWNTAFATFGNPNFMGTYLVLMIPIALHAFIKENLNFGAIVYMILLFCLLCTRTRGAWIGAFTALICYSYVLWYTKNRSKQMVIRQLIIVLLSLIIIISFNQISDGAFLKRFVSISTDVTDILNGSENAEKAGSFRFFIWKRVIKMIEEKPIFGFGIENLAEPFIERYEKDMIDTMGRVYIIDKAHNEYLNIAVTTGLPSLLVYLLLILNVIKIGFNRMRFNSLYWPLIASICGYLVQAFFNISVVSVAYIFWVFLGLVSRYFDSSYEIEGDNYEKF